MRSVYTKILSLVVLCLIFFISTEVFQVIQRFTEKQHSTLSPRRWTTNLRKCTLTESKTEANKLKCPQKKLEGLKTYYKENISISWSDENALLKPDVYAWWRSLQGVLGWSFANPQIYLKQLFSHGFSARNNFNTKQNGCLSCAIVGNSHIVRETCYGKLIDAHDFVIRFNEAITVGYEPQVGGRTTHLFSFSESCPERLAQNVSLVFIPYKKADLKWLKSATSDGSYRLWSYRAAYDKLSVNKSKVIILHPEFIKYVHDDWTQGAGNYASTGMLATIAALHICDTVSIFGFGADKNGMWQHYFEVLDSSHFRSSSHSQEVEANLLKDLEKQGAILRYY